MTAQRSFPVISSDISDSTGVIPGNYIGAFKFDFSDSTGVIPGNDIGAFKFDFSDSTGVIPGNDTGAFKFDFSDSTGVIPGSDYVLSSLISVTAQVSFPAVIMCFQF